MTRRWTFALTCSFCAAAASADPDASPWVELFNGRDLSGWQANAHPESFTIIDGAIRAHCTIENQRSHLFYVGADPQNLPQFCDFELVAIVRAEPGSNSGIFFHTDRDVRDDKLHLASGYEVQLNNSPRIRGKTGSLYDIVNLDESPVDESRWFELRVTVRGKRIVIAVEGRVVVDYTEPPNPQRPANRKGRLLRDEGGAIALQAHDPQSVYHFKSIRIRRLP